MGPLLAALFVALGSAPETVSAPPSLDWFAPPECPDAAAVGGRIVRLVGGPSGSPSPPVVGRIVRTRDDAGYVLDLRVGEGGAIESRRVTADSCDALADVAALLVAVVTEPVATATQVEVGALTVPAAGGTSDEAPTSRGRTPRVRASSPPPVVRTPTTPTTVSLRARLGASVGASPGATGGIDLGLAIGGTRVRGELVGAYWFPRRTSAGNRSLRVSLGTISPRVCGLLPQRRVSVVGCLGPEIGVMRGVSDGIVRRPLWMAAVVEVGARISLGRRFALWTSAGVAAPLRFPVFRVRGADGDAIEVFRPSSVSGRLLVGFEGTFGRARAKSR